MKQELLVALRAAHRRGGEATWSNPVGRKRSCDTHCSLAVTGAVPHDPSCSDAGPSHFELRLDEHDVMRSRAAGGRKVTREQCDGNEGAIDHDDVERCT